MGSNASCRHGYAPLVMARVPAAHHGEGLAGAGLSVGEAGGAAPAEEGGDQGEARLAVDLFVRVKRWNERGNGDEASCEVFVGVVSE